MAVEDYLTYQTSGRTARAFRVVPNKPRATVLVLHEVWGFSAFIQGFCRRIASLGYLALAPLLYWNDSILFEPETIRQAMDTVWHLSLAERYDRSTLSRAIREKHAPEKVGELLNRLYDRDFRVNMVQKVLSLVESAASEVTPTPVGAVGFSMGGGLALKLASRSGRIRACVVFSAEPPDLDTMKTISSPILAFYGADDTFMTRDVPRFVRDALRCRKEFILKTYPSAGHEFFFDTTTSSNSSHKPSAASDSWELSTHFLRRTLEANY